MSEWGPLIEEIYRAALGESSWVDVVDHVAKLFDAKSAIVRIAQENTDSTYIHTMINIENDQMEPYEKYFIHQDMWLRKIKSNDDNKVVSGTDLIDYEKLTRSTFFNEYLVPYLGIHDTLVATRNRRDGLKAIFAVNRGVKNPLFGNKDREAMQTVGRHISRAAEIFDRVTVGSSFRSGPISALDYLPDGIVLCDRDGRVVVANAAAREFGCRANRSVVYQNNITDFLVSKAVFDVVVKNKVAQSIKIDGGDGETYFLLVSPFFGLPAGQAGITEAKVLRLIRNAGSAPSMTQLEEIFGFSRAESEVALALGRGERVEEIAVRRNVRISTIRTQISSILAKAGVSRQSELLSILGGIPKLWSEGR